ncbi:MAG: hypothetical protein KKC75_00095 [Nanoarchaeota archaeon]|nr:hypothetical protein [Nanoarchaeota archaeon]
MILQVEEDFLKKCLKKCGFKSGIALKPEEIMQLSDRTAFLHEFSRSARSVLLSGLESAIYGDCVNLLTRYILSLEKVQGISFRKQPLLKYLETETEIKGAVASIIEFMGANLILGTELSEIYHMLACEPLWGIPIVGLDCASPFPVNYHLEGNIVGVKVISDNVGFRYIVSEVFCNAQKVGDRRGIEAKIDCDVSEIGYDGLPESARDFYDRNPLSKRNIILIGALLDSPKHLRYIKVSIRDNCGGFKGDVEGHFRKNVSGTGSTGQGLAMLRNSQERLLYSLEVLNTPGEGAMFNFYFVKG